MPADEAPEKQAHDADRRAQGRASQGDRADEAKYVAHPLERSTQSEASKNEGRHEHLESVAEAQGEGDRHRGACP